MQQSQQGSSTALGVEAETSAQEAQGRIRELESELAILKEQLQQAECYYQARVLQQEAQMQQAVQQNEELARQLARAREQLQPFNTALMQWEVHVDAESGDTFYHNAATNEGTWQTPVGFDEFVRRRNEEKAEDLEAVAQPEAEEAAWRAATKGAAGSGLDVELQQGSRTALDAEAETSAQDTTLFKIFIDSHRSMQQVVRH